MKTININFINDEDFKQDLSDVKFSLTDENILVKVFSGNLSKKSLEHTLKIIKKHIPNGVIIGATSSGEFLEENVLENSTIVSISHFEKSFLKIVKVYEDDKNSAQIGKELAQKLQGDDLKIAVLFANMDNLNGEEFLEKFSDDLNEKIYISGGFAGGSIGQKNSYVLHGDEVISSGVVGVGIYSKNLRISLKYSFDWDPIGPEFTVEKASYNVIKQIDGMTPKDLYAKYLGEDTEHNFSYMCVGFPFIVERNGVLVARAGAKMDENGYIHCSGNLYEGEKIYIGVGNINKIINRSIEIYNEIDEQWDSVFVYSCELRKVFLDSNGILDARHFANIAPTSGFFTHGEFFKEPNGSAYCFNETLTVLLMSEDMQVKKNTKKNTKETSYGFLGALSNIVNQVAKDHKKITNNLNQLVRVQTDKLHAKNKQLLQELYFDSLTQLKNRKSIIKDIEKLKPKALLLIDIQSFGTFNDLYGESVGNTLLKNFALYLKKSISDENITIYRILGNTFALTTSKSKKQNDYIKECEQIIYRIENTDFSFQHNGVVLDFALNIRAGLATFHNSVNLIENADMALSHAKKGNVNFAIYDPKLEIEKLYKKDIQIIKITKNALLSDGIVPYFQPIYKKDFTMYESLARLVKKDGTVLTPYYFLDIVKSTKMYFQITQRMIEKTFQIFQHLPFEFSVNLSYLDIKHSNTLDFIEYMLKKYNISNRLTVEIIESDAFKNYEITAIFLKALKKLNVKIAIDDFGSGYSNFTHLVELEPDYIKLDGSLIKDIDINPKTFAITKSIVDIANKLDIKVIAEFIHSKEVYEKVKSLDVDGYQGFYLGKPKDYEEVFATKNT